MTRTGTSGSVVLPPEHAEVEGGIVTVTRVWPEKASTSRGAHGSSRLAVEAVDAQGRLRAGWFQGAGDGRLDLFPAGTDPRLPRLEQLSGSGVVVSHRPHRRAVVRTEAAPEPSGAAGSRFIKLVRPGRARGILEGVARAAAFDGPFRTPEVLGHDEASVTFSALSGSGLHEVSDDGAPLDWERAWDEVLAAWGEAVRRPVDGQDLPVHDAAEEVAVLHRWTELAMPVLRARDPEPELFVEAVAAAAEALAGLPVGSPRPAHRDLHDKQVLWSAELGPGLLDVDTACLADPALDLGNLRAHATWRQRQGVWSTAQAETVRGCVDVTAEKLSGASGASVAEAVAVYEQASLLRLLCVYAFRPRYTGLVDQLRGELRPGRT
ncbi:hypothetical protein [Nesterenkonia sp. HG001]|uniref:hypothetical protein n=1 Tax=Nesterenkonia sp. HG001 TaxID=2983207 RepID=UPI002AC492F3|nr:hypothetical protein [Nesterenkonia sp. HG001]MDZ5078670.1 hypothetical protein [Nesterenkonia sp. HG001]